MANVYLTVKTLHILSATLLLGTGLGTAFFMFMAYRSGRAEAFAVTCRHVVLADWLFTLPAVLIQLLTGLWLGRFLGIEWSSIWLLSVLTLFAVVGACWIPVVFIQIRLSRLASPQPAGRNQAAESAEPAGPAIDALMRAWTALGIPAFLLTLVLLGLMVLRPVIS